MNRQQYAAAVLQHGGWPETSENLQALVAVMVGEGSRAHYNPLDTTQPAPGATYYTVTGVRDYPDLSTAVEAVVSTLTNGDYGPVVAALASGTSAGAVVRALATSPWGTWTSPAVATAVLAQVRSSWPAAGDVELPGTTAAVSPSPPPPEGDSMIAADPTSKGLWVARPDGAVYAFGGAPYLGGLNNHPDWGRGGQGQPQCVGIAFDPLTSGYALAVDGDGLAEPEVYRFPRSAVYA